MTQADADHTGVIMPPPVIYLGALLLVSSLHWIWPVPVVDHAAMLWTGIVLLVVGAGINGWGVYTLYRGNTAVHPSHPASRLITSGPFGFSRNPLYVGLTVIYIGVTLMLNSLWGLLLFVPLLLVMHHGVVLREEQHLEARFGDEFRQYCARVRRYL